MSPSTKAKYLLIFSAPIFLIACGGGGGGSSYLAPSVTGTTWASDHTTRTLSYSDGSSVVDTVNPTTSTPTYTPENYTSDWATGGNVYAPSVSSKNYVYGDGFTSVLENGSAGNPFSQATLSAISASDPNAYVTSSTRTYILTWGTPDTNGPVYANLFPNPSTALANPLQYVGRRVTSFTSLTNGPTLMQPSTDVLAAWNKGWTGRGQNILMVDSYANIASCDNTSTNSCHGVNTMMITDLVAPGATKYALDGSTLGTSFANTPKDGATGGALSGSVGINVVNASVTAYSWCGNGCGTVPSDAAYNDKIASTANFNIAYANFFSGASSIAGLTNLSNAVIVKAAGNDALNSKYDVTTLALSQNASIASRLLVVGALNKNGSVASPASLASYSNFSGSTTGIAERFVLANGNTPYANSSVGINGYTAAAGEGTSYAAPIVAGYSAILMQKFPNITAASTSSIILDTARTDTLSCSPSCDPAIYGKGEASLSRALAPVGRLR